MWNQLKFILERPKAIARPWWTLPKICFIIFKRYIPKQFFSLTKFLSESIHGLRAASKNRSKAYGAPCIYQQWYMTDFLGFLFRVILNLYGIIFHPAVVKWPEHDFLFESASTYCVSIASLEPPLVDDANMVFLNWKRSPQSPKSAGW